jgi:hypothetical protein
MNRKRWSAGLLGLALAIGLASPAWADPPAGVPGGPCIEDQQQVRLDSLPSYQEVARQLASIGQSSQGAVEVRSAGRSGEGRELLYATVGHGRMSSGCRPGSTDSWLGRYRQGKAAREPADHRGFREP